MLLRLKITECIFAHESFARFRQFRDFVTGLRVRNAVSGIVLGPDAFTAPTPDLARWEKGTGSLVR